MKKIISVVLVISLLCTIGAAFAEGPGAGRGGNGGPGGRQGGMHGGNGGGTDKSSDRNGDGVKQDYDEALPLFPEACEAGSMKGDST